MTHPADTSTFEVVGCHSRTTTTFIVDFGGDIITADRLLLDALPSV